MKYYHMVTDIVIPITTQLQEEGIKRLKKYGLVRDIYSKENQIPDYALVIKIPEIEKKIKLKKSYFSRPEQIRILVCLFLALYCEPEDKDLANLSDALIDSFKTIFSEYLVDKHQLTFNQFLQLEKYYDDFINFMNKYYSIATK